MILFTYIQYTKSDLFVVTNIRVGLSLVFSTIFMISSTLNPKHYKNTILHTIHLLYLQFSINFSSKSTVITLS